MSTIHLIIRKVNLSEFANSEYFVNMNQLVTLPLTEDQFSKLIKYVVSINDVKATYRTIYEEDTEWIASKAFGPIPVSGENPLLGYALFGVTDLKRTKDLFSTDTYLSYVANRQEVFEFLQWSITEDRVIDVEAVFDETTMTWNVPYDFASVESFYNQGQDLQQVLETIK